MRVTIDDFLLLLFFKRYIRSAESLSLFCLSDSMTWHDMAFFLSLFSWKHGLRTPNEGINQNLKSENLGRCGRQKKLRPYLKISAIQRRRFPLRASVVLGWKSKLTKVFIFVFERRISKHFHRKWRKKYNINQVSLSYLKRNKASM